MLFYEMHEARTMVTMTHWQVDRVNYRGLRSAVSWGCPSFLSIEHHLQSHLVIEMDSLYQLPQMLLIMEGCRRKRSKTQEESMSNVNRLSKNYIGVLSIYMEKPVNWMYKWSE